MQNQMGAPMVSVQHQQQYGNVQYVQQPGMQQQPMGAPTPMGMAQQQPQPIQATPVGGFCNSCGQQAAPGTFCNSCGAKN